MLKMIRNHIGMSLVEVMIAAGAVGGLSLTIAKLMQNTNQSVKRAEIRNEYVHVQNRIIANLSDEISCYETLKSVPIAANSTAPLSAIVRCQETEEVDHPLAATDALFANMKIRRCKPGATQAIYNSSDAYGSETFNVSFDFRISNVVNPTGGGTGTGVGELQIKFRPTEKGRKTSNLAPYEIQKAYEVIFEHDGNNLIRCYNNENNVVNTAVARACTGPNARLEGDINDSSNPLRCVHDVDTDARCAPNQVFDGYEVGNHSATGEAQTLIPRCIELTEKSAGCNSGEYVVERDDGAGVSLSCHSIPVCERGQHLSRGADGLLECTQIAFNCPANSLLITKADGTPECKSCGQNEMLIRSSVTGAWECRSPATACIDISSGASLNNQQYMVGLNPDGTAMCRNLIEGTDPQCPTGSKLVIGANGGVTTACCPACSRAESDNYCLGQLFASSNRCSVCTGTKPVRNAVPNAWYVVQECSSTNHKRLLRRDCVPVDDCEVGDRSCAGHEMEKTEDCMLHGGVHTYAQCAASGGQVSHGYYGAPSLCYFPGNVPGGRMGGASHNDEVNKLIIGSHGHVSCPAGWNGLQNYSSASYFGCSCSRSRKTSCGSCAMPECSPAGAPSWYRQNRMDTSSGYDARRTKKCLGGCKTSTDNFTCYPRMTERGCY